MTKNDVALLVISANSTDGERLEQNLAQTGHSRCLHFCHTNDDAHAILQHRDYDAILTDHQPPQIDIFALLEQLKRANDGTPVVVLTGTGSEKLASEAIKQGAYDYLTTEELSGSSIFHILETVFERRRLKEEARRTQRRLKQMALQDSLTEVYNRRYFQDRLEKEFLRSQRYKHPLSVVMLDIDYFKEINDSYGHLKGDDMLISVAHVLNQALRRVDVVARYGGDEFAVILPETSHRNAVKMAERLHKHIGQIEVAPTQAGSTAHTMSASLGVASMGPAIQKPEDLLGRADQALYAAKANGRNQVFSDQDLQKTRRKVRVIQ